MPRAAQRAVASLKHGLAAGATLLAKQALTAITHYFSMAYDT